jgi:hypothetical protein
MVQMVLGSVVRDSGDNGILDHQAVETSKHGEDRL